MMGSAPIDSDSSDHRQNDTCSTAPSPESCRFSSSNEANLLSDYQKQRLDNIRRNNARLRSLGLFSAIEEQRSNARAAAAEMGVLQPKSHGGNRQRKRKAAAEAGSSAKPKEEGSRKSLRLQGMEADRDQALSADADDDNEDDDYKARLWNERKAIVEECREARLRAANVVAELGAEAAARENPTATYQHCLMRVLSMTDKALANRVKAIEKACGKHCVVKMAIFKCCLQDQEKWELATEASEALERLKALQPIPKD